MLDIYKRRKSEEARFAKKILVWPKMGHLGPKRDQNEVLGLFLEFAASDGLQIVYFVYTK